jgi:hypothetical protein
MKSVLTRLSGIALIGPALAFGTVAYADGAGTTPAPEPANADLVGSVTAHPSRR